MLFDSMGRGPLFSTEADSGAGNQAGGEPEPEKGKDDSKSEKAAKEPKAKENKPSEKTDKETSELERLKAREAELKYQIDEFKKKEQAELDKQKTAEQKLAEREAELAKVQRDALVERVRRKNGFNSKVFDAVVPVGDTEAEIKSSFDEFKASLDEYTKDSGVKSAQGTGTENGLDPKKSSTTNGRDTRPYLERIGIVKPKQAV